jgi:hypothetical protein
LHLAEVSLTRQSSQVAQKDQQQPFIELLAEMNRPAAEIKQRQIERDVITGHAEELLAKKRGAPTRRPLSMIALEQKLPAITAAATAAAITATVAETARPSFLGSGFVHGQVTAVEIRAVQSLNRSLRFLGVSHFDKAKTTGTTGKFIRDHAGRFNRPVRRKKFLQLRVGSRVRQPTNVNFTAHVLSL